MTRELVIALVMVASVAEAVPPRSATVPRGCRDRGCVRSRTAGGDYAFAFFEFAPENGAGMTPACACTTPTGAKGEAMTFTRASSGTCLKGGTATGIANGDMVTCSTDQPRVGPGGNGTGPLKILIERARSNDCLRSAELCNAAWADVGTPSCSSDQQTGPLGTATMDQFTDNDAAAKEGRSQAITTTNTVRFSASCFVKAGTATSATITLVGASNSVGDCSATATGLSTTTSTRISCSSSAAYGASPVSVTVSILVGADVTDTGTLFVEGCQVEGAVQEARSPGSYIATTSAPVTRQADRALFSGIAWPSSATFSHAFTWVTPAAFENTNAHFVIALDANNYASVFTPATGVPSLNWVTSAVTRAAPAATAIVAGTTVRLWDYVLGTGTNEIIVCSAGGCGTANGHASVPSGIAGTGTIYLGWQSAGFECMGWIGQVCYDPSSTRCR